MDNINYDHIKRLFTLYLPISSIKLSFTFFHSISHFLFKRTYKSSSLLSLCISSLYLELLLICPAFPDFLRSEEKHTKLLFLSERSLLFCPRFFLSLSLNFYLPIRPKKMYRNKKHFLTKFYLKEEYKSVRTSLGRVPRRDSGPGKETVRAEGPNSARGRSRPG